ncbi:MAG: hydrolase [bacterium]
MAKENDICCPEFQPELWNDKVFDWEGKRFIRENIRTFFYMPMNYGSVMKRIGKLFNKEGIELFDQICLSDHTSKWNMDIYIAIDNEIQDADNHILSGKFYSRVYEGNFKDTEKWTKDFSAKAIEKGYRVKKWYMWYTTCPKCAKKYGKNYVAVVGEVE